MKFSNFLLKPLAISILVLSSYACSDSENTVETKKTAPKTQTSQASTQQNANSTTSQNTNSTKPNSSTKVKDAKGATVEQNDDGSLVITFKNPKESS